MAAESRFKTYYQLAKPGIIYGNAITAIAGFFLASKGHFDPWLFLMMLVGICLVMASGCVFNNFRDRKIDALMKRTSTRALVKGTISTQNALIYGTALGLLGIWALLGTNLLTLAIALFGLFVYVVWYGVAKRNSVHGTLVGAIAGAVPPVVGYCAVTNSFDTAALLLFLVLAIWQMPHFYAIAMFRADDYKEASIPVLPLVKGMTVTQKYILGYIVAFILACAAFTAYSYTGIIFAAVTCLLGAAWLWIGLSRLKTLTDKVWARQMFRFSLWVLLGLSLMLSVDVFLP